MDGYPLDLILAIATATASIFLGALPTKTTSPTFLAHATLRIAIAWLVTALVTPLAIIHFPLFFALLTLVAWWKFREDEPFSARIWLWIASGLGISLGVVLILAVTPRAWPDIFPYTEHYFILASIYLGGATLGLAGYCLILTRHLSTNSGITHGLLRRLAGLLLALTLLRPVALAGELFLPGGCRYDPLNHFYYRTDIPVIQFLPSLVLLALAFAAHRTTHLSSRVLPTNSLRAYCLLALLSESLIRLLAAL